MTCIPDAVSIDADILSSYAGRRVLVTGGFGFLGGHLCRQLLAAQAAVTIIDIDTSDARPSLINYEGLSQRIRSIQIDLANECCISTIAASGPFETVFHLAACSVIERAAEHPLEGLRANAMGFVHVMEALGSSQQAMPRVVLASTDKVYGEMNGNAYDEDAPLKGIGLYDAGKIAADVFAQSYFRALHAPTVVLRLCNVFGPADFNTAHRVFPRTLQLLFGEAQPRPPVLYIGAVSHERDYLYVDDAVRALLLVGAHPVCEGAVFNVASSSRWATPALISAIVDAAARLEDRRDCARSASIRKNGIVIGANHPSALTIRRQHLNSTRIRETVGFLPRVMFPEGLAATIAYYRDYFSQSW